MNKVLLVGRLTKEPETRYTTENKAVSRLNVACDRRYKSEDASADFISCVAFGKTAEFIEKYFHKGMKIGIAGRIQTGSYTDKNGDKRYTTDVVIDEAEFVEKKADAPAADQPTTETTDDFMKIPDDISGELPFV